jgi:hypothetical protein
MATNSSRFDAAKPLWFILGLACLVGFAVDLLIAAFPYLLNSAEWRVGILQQASSRSVVLLLGVTTLLYRFLDTPVIRKRLSQFCLGLGVSFLLSTVLVVNDSIDLRAQALRVIDTQVSQAQLELAKNSPSLTTKATLEQVQQATQVLEERAKTKILKTAAATIGNLTVVGLALIAIGRYGMRIRRQSLITVPPGMAVEDQSGVLHYPPKR